MKLKNNAGMLLAGLVVGMLMGAPTAEAAAEYLKALPSANTIYVDGQQVELEAYAINGSNYLKLRDVGKAVGFNVYWDPVNHCVQIETDKPYTGEAPVAVADDNAAAVEETATEQPDVEAMKQEMVAQTNALRREQGIAALITHDKLMEAAQVRAEEMAASSTYSHTRPDGSKFYTVTDCPYLAENIHRIADWQLTNATLADTAISAWANSEGHRKNMLNSSLTGIGVGLARGINGSGNPCWYCVQIFLYDGQTVTWVDETATTK